MSAIAERLAEALKGALPYLNTVVWGAADLSAEHYARAEAARDLARATLAEYEASLEVKAANRATWERANGIFPSRFHRG